ncbi:glycine--tRNA ligase [Texas Phoenix palm phytoplasma]|uniref:glycine--tRNA ligase n=1 Tax=Texas Phoenix palm phytoplasma TaxID=176709 RepID=A0ABS5BHZ5_9MOLU|nr:glycine--tRNA ligase [Texas Phoenix palm phytoplasma]MBP3059189.1 glycine--tRNA ligase [Texas Phoenix palm phytoplasma]
MIKLKDLIIFAKKYGFIFYGSEIYGGLSNSFDYGPLGSLLKQNIKKAWIKKFIQEQDNILLDSSIILNSNVWKASGHLELFIDPLVENKDTNKRYRADQLINSNDKNINTNCLSFEQMSRYLIENKILGTKNWSSVEEFNLLFQTYQGVVKKKANNVFLRPETCQGIFINFKNILNSTRKKIPFGVGQIGKSFRNEITPSNFIFRTCEFEQMELEFFCQNNKYKEWFVFWKEFSYQFLLKLGLKTCNINFKEQDLKELSHYSVATTDILFLFPWGFDELCGIACRTDFDLKTHQQHSKKDLQYFDENTKNKYYPYVIESSLGVERLFLAILYDSLKVEKLQDSTERTVLKIHPFLSPYKMAILPLIRKKHYFKAKEMQKEFSCFFEVVFDSSQSIGKRYRRQDAIGTPFCCTIDDQTLEDNTVTIRERDTLKQIRIEIKNIREYIENKIFL